MSERLDINGRSMEWAQLLDEALTVPGGLGNTYSRFYEYSMLNQLLLYLQGVREPVNTYNRWQAMGRQVLKGSKAKAILRPMFVKVEDKKTGETVQRVAGFKPVRCLFGVSETEGEALPPYEPKAWSKERALGALAITEAPFDQLNGNIQGFSFERQVAINPVAAYPFKTLCHEVGHIVLGHTSPDELAEYRTHRGIKEFEAEATAYLVVNELEATDAMDQSESRAYVQSWLKGERPDDRSIKRVFAATTQILKAGREVINNEGE